MFKRILLAATFVGAFTFAGLGTASSAKADVCYGRGFGPSYGGYGGFSRGGSFYRSGFRGNPYLGSPYYYRGGRDFGYRGFPAYGYRGRGVSFSFGY